MPLVLRGRSSHEDGVWKSLPAVHYNQKEQREWEKEWRDWNGCYSRITIRHQIWHKKYLSERLAGYEINIENVKIAFGFKYKDTKNKTLI